MGDSTGKHFPPGQSSPGWWPPVGSLGTPCLRRCCTPRPVGREPPGLINSPGFSLHEPCSSWWWFCYTGYHRHFPVFILSGKHLSAMKYSFVRSFICIITTISEISLSLVLITNDSSKYNTATLSPRTWENHIIKCLSTGKVHFKIHYVKMKH